MDVRPKMELEKPRPERESSIENRSELITAGKVKRCYWALNDDEHAMVSSAHIDALTTHCPVIRDWAAWPAACI